MKITRILLLVFLVSGCASTTEHYPRGVKKSLCMPSTGPVSVDLYWATDWRENQKEPTKRSKHALEGINRFANSSNCLRVSNIERIKVPSEESYDAIVENKHMEGAKSNKIIFITFTELGPTLEIGLPALVRGHTEVKFELRGYNTQSKEKILDSEYNWKNGGAFIIKGVSSLSRDVEAALNESLLVKKMG